MLQLIDSAALKGLLRFLVYHLGQYYSKEHHFSGASGSLSMTYLPFATLIIGTPGILRIRLFRSLSFVATM